MSRLTKWKLEKAKVKVVFRLQFHATHIPQTGWDKLFISFIPSDSVKPTAKTTKALVRNGTCKWGDPIYETTRLLQDTRTKQYDEKLYKIVVGMGTSRSSILGESMINLAEYADALKPSAIALPLQGCDSGAILHVTIQLLTSKTGFREFEQQREISERGTDLSPDESSRSKPSDETSTHVDKVRMNEFDVSSSTSGSLHAERHEIDSLKSGDLSGLVQSDLSNAMEENIKLKGLLEEMELSINEVKNEVTSLQSHADGIGSKAQEFSQILISEIGSSDQLVREVSMLKSECLKLKGEVERLRNVNVSDIHQTDIDPLKYLGMSELSTNAMKDKILELVRGLDESNSERDSLTKKMDQMECYYESLVQELEETQRQLLVELQNVRTEHSTCIYSISGAKAEMETLREQMLRFSEEKRSLECLNVEIDKRAISAEAALKRARLNYSIAVNHLQKDLELLSSQVVSMYETNENLIKQAFPDPLQCIKPSTRDLKLMQLQNEKIGMKESLQEDLKRSLRRQECLYQKVEGELYEMHSRNLYLEVFSSVLQETFFEASVHMNIMKGKIDELGWELELSIEAKEMLKQRLDIALDEVCSLKEEKITCIANLHNITHENRILLQKIDELEPVLSERKEVMEKEAAEKVHLQSNLATVQAELDDMENNFSSFKDKLMNTIGSYSEKLISLPIWEGRVNLDLESGDLTEKLDKLLCKLCENSFVLATENKDLMKTKSKTESYIMELKQKHENDLKCLVTKLEGSTAILQKLQLEKESIVSKNETLSEEISELAEDKKGLLVSLLDKSQENLGLVREIENLKKTFDQELRLESSLKQELETKMQDLTSELEIEKASHAEVLTALNGSRDIGAKYMDHNTKLLADVDSFKSELQVERGLREKLDIRVKELTSELDEKSEYVRNAHRESTSIEELFQCLIATNIQLGFTQIQLETCIDDLAEQLNCCSKSYLEFQTKHSDVKSALNQCLLNEMRYMEENSQLLIRIEDMKSELDSYMAQNRALTARNDEMLVEQLKTLLVNHEEEIENLMVLKTEAEFTVEVIKGKLIEHCIKGASEIETLKNRCGDLTQKLSEQILKTEEFKSLSIHLKELKDNAEAECTSVREKIDYQAPLTPQQESLRIIFIKEQYETKLHELQHQLSMSKKHSEEILIKLQDTIDENEARKKAESVQLKRNKDYDMMKAELDCSLLSLECCKEEKQKVEEERLKLSKEIESMRELSNLEDDQMESVDSFSAETLRSSLDHLNSELERMKNENLLQPQDGNDSEIRFTGFEHELIQTRQAKEDLREMHDRYSQLSLKFAEVEGERQKLMMILKNAGATKKGIGKECS